MTNPRTLTPSDKEIILVALEWALHRLVSWSRFKRLSASEQELMKRIGQIALIVQGREQEIEQQPAPNQGGGNSKV